MYYFIQRPKRNTHPISYTLQNQGVKLNTIIEHFAWKYTAKNIVVLEFNFLKIPELEWSINTAACAYFPNRIRINKTHPITKKRDIEFTTTWPQLELEWVQKVSRTKPELGATCISQYLATIQVTIIPESEIESTFLKQSMLLGWKPRHWGIDVILQKKHQKIRPDTHLQHWAKLKVTGIDSKQIKQNKSHLGPNQ